MQLRTYLSTFSASCTWLYRVTTNLLLMRFRMNRRELVSLDQECSAVTHATCRSESIASGLSTRLDLERAIKLLPNGYRTAVILHEFHGYQHKEIATICGSSVGNSKSQLHKARKRLRSFLSGTSKDELLNQYLNEIWSSRNGRGGNAVKARAANGSSHYGITNHR
jgi:RNA polymerase sigma-70 factor, ECF subfamily